MTSRPDLPPCPTPAPNLPEPAGPTNTAGAQPCPDERPPDPLGGAGASGQVPPPGGRWAPIGGDRSQEPAPRAGADLPGLPAWHWLSPERLPITARLLAVMTRVNRPVRRSVIEQSTCDDCGIDLAAAQNVILQMVRFGLVRHAHSHCKALGLTELGRRWLDSDEGRAVLAVAS